jgi:hypothetical protein
MCRSSAEGGRRCPGNSRAGSLNPPADGKTRVEVHTSKRSYSVIGGAQVPWLPGEKVVSIDAIEPGQHPAAGQAGDDGPRESYEGSPWQGYDEYMQRSAELDRRIAAGETMTGIMRAEQLRRGQERIAQIAREGW